MANLKVKLGKLHLKNPVMTASGTFGYGTEYLDFVDMSRIGGIIVKGTTLRERQGNPYPRMAETPSGMLNAVGLQNKGIDYFIDHIYPTVKDFDTSIFVNVSGSTIEDYIITAEKLNDLPNVPGIELNISCPNVKEGGMAFGTSCLSEYILLPDEKVPVLNSGDTMFPRRMWEEDSDILRSISGFQIKVFRSYKVLLSVTLGFYYNINYHVERIVFINKI
jgi:dihydroorotate dehydrogenase